MYHVAVVALSGVLALAGSTLPPDTSPDTDVAGNVIAAAGERLLALGFASAGPPAADPAAASACLGGLDVPGAVAEFPGETSRAVSDTYAVFETEDTGEVVTVALFVVEEDNASTLDWPVRRFGNEDTASCKLDEFMTPEVQQGPDPVVDVTATPDLGVGDGSSRLDMTVAVPLDGGATVQFSQTFALARQANVLVVVSHLVAGEPISEFDPQAELTSVVDSLAAAQSSA